MDDIFVEQLIQTPVEEQAIELVERKGLGHPDSICDSIANCASVALCQEYKRSFGRILHHNLDKALLVAGSSSPRVGGGMIEKPMRLILGDRATSAFQGKSIDGQGIVIEAAKDWIRHNLRFVDPERHMIFQSEKKAGSPELTGIFDRGRMGANDTSAAVGFAPLTLTEQVVSSVEKYMNSPQFKRQFPETGEDIKVMGLRLKRELHLTIAVAFVDSLRWASCTCRGHAGQSLCSRCSATWALRRSSKCGCCESKDLKRHFGDRTEINEKSNMLVGNRERHRTGRIGWLRATYRAHPFNIESGARCRSENRTTSARTTAKPI